MSSSVEDLVSGLTLAIEGLTKAVEAQTVLLSTPKPADWHPAINAEIEADRKAAVADTKKTTNKKEPEKTKEPVAEVEEVKEGPSEKEQLEALAADFTDLVEKDIDAARAILTEYGIKKLSFAEVADYPAISAKTKAAIEKADLRG